MCEKVCDREEEERNSGHYVFPSNFARTNNNLKCEIQRLFTEIYHSIDKLNGCDFIVMDQINNFRTIWTPEAIFN